MFSINFSQSQVISNVLNVLTIAKDRLDDHVINEFTTSQLIESKVSTDAYEPLHLWNR